MHILQPRNGAAAAAAAATATVAAARRLLHTPRAPATMRIACLQAGPPRAAGAPPR